MASLKPLIMRANRLLGANLVEKNLVSIDALDAANERLLELMSGAKGDAIQVSLLAILAHEGKALAEESLLQHLVEENGLGLIDVRNIDLPDELRLTLRAPECWATWTVPFDQIEDTTYLATAYYLSPPVKTFWEEKIQGRIIWFATTLESITEFLEKLEAEAASAASAN